MVEVANRVKPTAMRLSPLAAERLTDEGMHQNKFNRRAALRAAAQPDVALWSHAASSAPAASAAATQAVAKIASRHLTQFSIH